MESVFLFVFLGFIFGATMLMLVMGYRSMEEERARSDARQIDLLAGAEPVRRFFRNASPRTPVATDGGDEAAVRRVRRYVEAEHCVAARFVSEPTVENLLREPAEPFSLN